MRYVLPHELQRRGLQWFAAPHLTNRFVVPYRVLLW